MIKNKLLVALLMVFIVSAIFLSLMELFYTNIQAGKEFDRMDFSESIYFLYDAGAVDINEDGVLDLFTSNHFALQRIMLGDGTGKFNDVIGRMHLYQDDEFPNIEDMGGTFQLDKDGVHIYWQNNILNIRNQSIHGEDIQGEIELDADVNVNSTSDNNIEVHTTRTLSGSTKTKIKFRLIDGGYLELSPELIAIPIKFSINKNFNLEKLYLGPNQYNPQSQVFSIFLRDRHGMAWADIDGDSAIDVFIARGGLKGRMLKQPKQSYYMDELLINVNDRYVNNSLNSGLEKNGCSGHQAAWVDFDNDGKLDLYITCRRAKQPNQLYKQLDDFQFVEIAKQFSLDREGKWLGPFLWLDYDSDGDQDLILEEDNNIWLYVNNNNNNFSRQLIISNINKISKFTVADYDLDGDQDIFASSSIESVLLVNSENSFVAKKPSDVGLPLQAETANWVDYDNDGVMDLHLVPGGLFRQQIDHKFSKTGILDHLFHTSVEDARSTWFDMDNDGDRDLLMAVKRKPSIVRSVINRLTLKDGYKLDWNIYLYRNLSEENNWLQIKLIGPKGNRQAIGARVAIENTDGSKYQQIVGNAEGSHSSQGHYRLYYGIAKEKVPESIAIFWPDGKAQLLDKPILNQLMTIEYE